MALLLRDQFLTDANPLVDGPAEPGPGPRDVTGSRLYIDDESLRGGLGAAAWGESKLTYPSHARQDGLALWAVVKFVDKNAEQGFGWASSAAVADPNTNGHHFINSEGYPRISTPGKLITLNGFPDVGKFGVVRATEYLVCVVLRAQGAFYLVSSHAAHTRAGVANSNDYPGIPSIADGQARVFWVEDSDTTSPMYPHAGFLNAVGPLHDNRYEDVRVEVVPEWATDAGLASFLDRFVRPDSTTSVGSGWVASGGVGGISGNKAYIVSNSGSRTFIRRPGAASSGDGIWRWKVTVGSTPTNQIECHFRFVDTSNWCQIEFRGGSVWLVSVKAGAGNVIANYPFALSAGQDIDVCVITKGDRYQLILNGTVLLDYVQDTTAANLTGTGIGYGSWQTAAVGARWKNVMFVPSIVALPETILSGAMPHIFTPGATIATDDFTGADGTPLNGRTTTTGAKEWQADSGYELNGNRARNTNIGGAEVEYFATIDAETADYEVSISVTTKPSGDRLLAGAVVRYADSNNHIYVRVLIDPGQPSNHEIELWEIINGTSLDTIRQMIGGYYADNTAYTLKVQCVGRFIHVFLNNEPILSYVISSQMTGTRAGLYHSGADDGSSFDTFALSALTDPSASGATHPLDGESIGASAASASGLSVAHALSGDSAGASAASAGVLSVAHALSGSSLGVSSAAVARILMGRPLSGESVGTSSALANLSRLTSSQVIYDASRRTPAEFDASRRA